MGSSAVIYCMLRVACFHFSDDRLDFWRALYRAYWPSAANGVGRTAGRPGAQKHVPVFWLDCRNNHVPPLLPTFRRQFHEIRCADQGCAPLPPKIFLRDLDRGIAAWMNENAAHPRTMVLVAAAGGGVRAAYWTASVLGAIEDGAIKRGKTDFMRKIFAISAVSGGALGAGAFAALNPGFSPEKPICRAEHQNLYPFRSCLSRFLGNDFMSPIMASFLTGDLVRRVVPGLRLDDWVASFPVDRADALERAWEAAWLDTFGTDRLSRPFDELWVGSAQYHPSLLLNGTLAYSGELSGERAVTSNLRLRDPWALSY